MSASSRLPHPVCSGFSFCLLYSVLSLLPCLSLSVSFNLSCLQVDIVCLVLSCLSHSVSSSLSVLSCLFRLDGLYSVLSLLSCLSRSVSFSLSCLQVNMVCLVLSCLSHSVSSSLSGLSCLVLSLSSRRPLFCFVSLILSVPFCLIQSVLPSGWHSLSRSVMSFSFCLV